MYAVIETGGKQYRVAEGQRIKIEMLPAEVGQAVEFDKVLMLADGEKIELGKPFIDGKKVAATVIDQGRGKKIKIVKMRRRKNSKRQAGHRQYFTEVQIDSLSGAKKAPKKAKAKTADVKAETSQDAEKK